MNKEKGEKERKNEGMKRDKKEERKNYMKTLEKIQRNIQVLENVN